jgi:hypothetical protein
LAIAVLPFILWQIERKSLFWSSIGIAFLIISHNSLAVLFLGLMLSYIILDLYVSKNKNELFKKYFLMVILSLGLSAFFWIPAFFELQYTVFSQTQVSEWSNYFASINLIGVSTLFVLFITVLFIVNSIIKVKKHRLTLLLFIVGLVSVFFSSSLSASFWNILPVSFIQFPFRFLSLSIVSVSFLAACIVSASPKKLKIPITILSLIILMLSAKPFLTPSEFFDKGEGFYATNMDTTTVKNEYMPKWVKQKPVERFAEKVEVVSGDGEVKSLSYNSKKVTFNVDTGSVIRVRVNTVYYPGWDAIVNNQKVEVDYTNKKGVMEFKLPKGENKVEVKFSETPLRLFADSISVISILFLIFYRIISTRTSHIKVKVSS